MKKYWFVYVATVFVSVGAFLYLTLFSINHIASLNVPEDALLGKVVWQQNGCIECHTIFGDGGYNAPDMTHETTRRTGEWLRAFFQNRPVMRPSQSKRHPGLGSEDTEHLIRYLQFVDRIKINNWPPKPLK